jgi:nitrous-oxide reductase
MSQEQKSRDLSRRGALGATAGGAALAGAIGGGRLALGTGGCRRAGAWHHRRGAGRGRRLQRCPGQLDNITASGPRARPARCASWASRRCAS